MMEKKLMLLLIVCVIALQATDQVNKLRRLFHHRGVETDMTLELGQVVFYCAHNPQISEVRSGQKDEKIFFIPNMHIDKSLEHQIDRFNSIKTKNYTAQIKKSAGGIQLTLLFDDEKVGLVWGNFVTIKNEAGVGFRLYNNEYLQALNKKQNRLLKTVSLGKKPHKPCIVIDCGHGGDDFGAIGFNNLTEKEVTLDVGLSVAKLLRSSGNNVFLTRDCDCSVALDSRTSYANSLQADLLVSIHANSAAHEQACGVETFCMPDNQFTISGSLLNGESKKLIRMDDEMRNRSSLNLAWMIQNNIMHLTQQKKIELVDRSVKRAVSQILAGSAMPSVLVEIGFLTNVQEAEKLGTKEYKLLLAQGISEGISRYVFHNFSDNFSLRNG